MGKSDIASAAAAQGVSGGRGCKRLSASLGRMSQVLDDVCAAAVFRPLQRRSVVLDVANIETGPSLHEQPDHVEVSGQSRLVQGRRVRVGAHRIISVRILSRIEQQPDDVRMAMLGRERKRQMSLVGSGREHGRARRIDLTCRRGGNQIETSAPTDERCHRLPLTVSESRLHGTVWIGTEVAQQIDEWHLHPAFAWHAAGTYKAQRHIDRVRIGSGAGIENGMSHLDDVGREAVVAHRILRNELQKRRLAEVVAPIEHHPLVNQAGMTVEMAAQALHVTVIEKVDGSTKSNVPDALVMGSI
jgi:hypothetical protein